MLHPACVYHAPTADDSDSKKLSKRDLMKAIKVLRYVARESMKETVFGKKIANDLHPIISTDLIVICDFWEKAMRIRA